jgi:hypothetical protein
VHHHSYVRESVHLPFKTARNIDSIWTEYFDNGTTCERSPRDWARSLKLDDQYQGIDLANGVADGRAVLIAPAEVVDFAKEQLRLYDLRQYPVLGGATNFYETKHRSLIHRFQKRYSPRISHFFFPARKSLSVRRQSLRFQKRMHGRNR